MRKLLITATIGVLVLEMVSGIVNISVAGEPTISIERVFLPGPDGQVHVRVARPSSGVTGHPFVLFHPTPASGDYYLEFMQRIAADRIVMAIDTPGYGDSTRPKSLPSIEQYAAAAAVALEGLGYGTGTSAKVDVLGYHTGGLIAVELARSRPDMVRRLVLPGLPFVVGEERKQNYDDNAVPKREPMRDGSHLADVWMHSTISVSSGVSLQRAQRLFTEEIQSYPYGWWGYHAAFTYESDIRFREVGQPVLLISTSGGLEQETKAASAYFENARYVHLENLSYGIFFVGIDVLVPEILAFLDE